MNQLAETQYTFNRVTMVNRHFHSRQLPAFFFRHFILFSTICFGFTYSVEGAPQARLTINAIESAAKTWSSQLDVYGEFEIVVTHTSEDGNAFKASGVGSFAKAPGIFRLKTDWNPITESDSTVPHVSFDFCSNQGLEVVTLKKAKVLHWKGLAVPDESISVAAKQSVSASETENIASRHPVAPVPTPMAFIGGWNEGVIFGGLSLAKKTAQLHRRKYFNDALQDREFNVKLDGTINEPMVIWIEDLLPANMKVRRALHFDNHNGWPIRTAEVYRSYRSDGTLLTSMDVDTDEFRIVGPNSPPFPLVLKVVLKTRGTTKSTTLNVIPESLRLSKREDFDFSVKKTSIPVDKILEVKEQGNIMDLNVLESKRRLKEFYSGQIR